MDTLSSAVEARVFDLVRKGGYDSDQVDRFMARVAESALALEEQLTASHAKIRGLERQLAETKSADRAVDVAFAAATDARDRLLEDAEKRAQAILEKAKREADDLSGPRQELELQRKEVDEHLARAERVGRQADQEADRLLEAARTQAERIEAEARRDALAALEESKKEAQDWVQQAQAEHQRVALMLRGLKAAVRDMLDEAAEQNEAIKVVLDEDVPEDRSSVRLPS